ncbi:MAG TPA: MIP/aquaporin family protein [Pyrinomonadaceae bacterium]|nr:MIP/aquaporin family protein [Pyrinomonadaceae bacterium]
MDLRRKIAAEFLGTAGLLAVVVGSGIMGERLSPGNAGVTLLANSIATAAGLIFLIYGFGHISGAHFNPAITLVETVSGRQGIREGLVFIAAQVSGAFAGVAAANVMFDLPPWFASVKVRGGIGQLLGEFIATFGLIGVVRLGVRYEPKLIGLLVASYITAAYWFTSSTSFANPAVTLARSASDTFTGIAPASVAGFVAAQFFGAVTAMLFFNWMVRKDEEIS